MIVQSHLSNRKHTYFESCVREAEKSDIQFQHGCVATLGGKIVARGYNTAKNYSKHDNFLENTCTCHAEVNVLRKLYHRSRRTRKMRKFHRMTLYISRVNRFGDCDYNSAPCTRCMEVINNLNIKQIVFYLDNEYHIVKPREYTTPYTSSGEKYLTRK